MNRLLRLLWLVIRSRWAERCSTLGPCRTRLRVWPNDLDVFLHVNNGVYFSLCDLARVDLMRLDITRESPPLPHWVERWKDDQRALREAIRAEADSQPDDRGRERAAAAREMMRK